MSRERAMLLALVAALVIAISVISCSEAVAVYPEGAEYMSVNLRVPEPQGPSVEPVVDPQGPPNAADSGWIEHYVSTFSEATVEDQNNWLESDPEWRAACEFIESLPGHAPLDEVPLSDPGTVTP